MGERATRKVILPLLKNGSLHELLTELAKHPPRQLLNPLFSGICSADEMAKWRAVTAMGVVVPKLADLDMEAARIVIRRMMWSLNDESGGIGWGAPEAMAEVLANHQGLAHEYTHILVAFMREDGFYLEYAPMQIGLMWGVGRLALVQPRLLLEKNVTRYQLPYLDSADRNVRALVAWSLGILKAKEAREKIKNILHDDSKIHLYKDNTLKIFTADHLAQSALANIS